MKIKRCGKASPLTKQQFLEILNDLVDPHRLIFALCWYTSERPITICRLKVSDVYDDRGKVRSTLVIPARVTKTRTTREVPTHRHLQALLSRYVPVGDDWLFPSDEDEFRHIPRDTYSRYLARVFARRGMVGYTCYSTRRGSLTHLARSGVGLRTIQQLSGHSRLDSLQHYLEVSEAELRETISLL